MDFTEMRLARTLGCKIDDALRAGEVLPSEVMEAYAELKKHWDWQMTKELS